LLDQQGITLFTELFLNLNINKMKKLLTASMIIISFSVHAQLYLATGLTTKGLTAAIGILTDKTDISIGYKMPMLSKENPHILNFMIGRQILITHDEGDNYSITPAIGYAECHYSKFDDKLNETKMRTTNAIYSVELGKDAYLGRFYAKGVYCKKPFMEVGLRFFVGR
jgi:hypothetical protein